VVASERLGKGAPWGLLSSPLLRGNCSRVGPMDAPSYPMSVLHALTDLMRGCITISSHNIVSVRGTQELVCYR
jgi:hypothetical protein